MRRNLLTFCAALFITVLACNKSNDNVTIHCDGLINNKPAGDPAFLLVASAFTPNSDGLNDFFNPIISQISSMSVKVYDINSNLVYQGSLGSALWSPVTTSNPLNMKYYYRVQATTTSGNMIGICGEVTPMTCVPKGHTKSEYTFQDQATPNGFTGVTAEVLVSCN